MQSLQDTVTSQATELANLKAEVAALTRCLPCCINRGEGNFSVDQVELLVSRVVLRAMTLRNKRTMRSSGGLAKSISRPGLTFVTVSSNITDVYEKVRANRRDIDKKCPRTKCDKILNKVKKVKASVEVIQTMNLTVLEQMVEMLKNSSTAQLLLDLEPIKACMTDPTVSNVIIIIHHKQLHCSLNSCL